MGNASINLVRGRKPRVLDQFVGWALTIGRGVVILTEVVALSAFLYRFSLDRQLIDLHDRIVQEQSIVALLKTNENSYRNLQNRLALSQTIITNQQQSVTIYTHIISLLSSDLILKSFVMENGSIKITLDTSSVTSLSNFIDRLRNDPNVTSVSIDRIENKTSIGLIGVNISVVLRTSLQPGQKKL